MEQSQQYYYLNCSMHSKQIVGVCIQQKCQNIRPSCLECLKQFHQDHINDVIEIDSLNIQIKRNSTKITQWLQEIESLVQIIRNCFESLQTENNVDDFTNSHALHDFIQKQMNNQKINMEVVQNNFQNVKQSLQILSESIFNKSEKQFEESDKLKQVKLLISKQGLHQSLQETKNFISKDNNTQIEQDTKIQQLMPFIFVIHPNKLRIKNDVISAQYLLTNEQSHFQATLTPSNIKLIENNTIAVQLEDREESTKMFTICGKLERNKNTILKFRIVKLNQWVGIGLCHRETIFNNKKPIYWDKANHGQLFSLSSLYMISNRNGQEKPYSWSSIDKEINFHELESFQLQEKDTIILTFDPLNSIVLWVNQKTEQSFTMKIKMDLDLHICVGLYKKGDSVEIIH